MQVIAAAHPNIALIKYWGKRDPVRNLPAVSSVSITLDTLVAETTLSFAPDGATDSLTINGVTDARASARAAKCLAAYHAAAGVPARAITATSDVNFPVAAGLASSAAGFAALVVGADALHGGRLPTPQLAQLAGAASGSAARSLFGGFVHLAASGADGKGIEVSEVLPAHEWPLSVVIAVTTHAAKDIGSTEGMERTRATSPYYDAWVDSQPSDIEDALAAICTQDFARLADVAEFNCLKMHAVMQSARPGLVYWNAATVDAIHAVRALRQRGIGVFFTIDAGPQLKAVCEPADADAVAAELAAIPGVIDVVRAGLGPGAMVHAC